MARTLTSVVQLRMTAEQHDRVRERAAARGINASTAARELIDLGLVLEDVGQHGLLVTHGALQLLQDGSGATAVQLIQGLTDDEIAWLREHGNERITEQDAERLRGVGMVVMATTEEVAALHGLGSP